MMGFFFWPVLCVIPVMIGMAVFMVLRSGSGRSTGPGCTSGALFAHPEAPVKLPPGEDPIVTLRERYARGEIDTAEFERRIEGLLRSDPNETIPWSNTTTPGESPRGI